jgi:5-hydroxyisourate hydrolase-like protein (transthyretin family)
MKTLIFIFLLSFSNLIFAQFDKTRSKLEDATRELEGQLTLHFFDALNGKPIEGAKVSIENIGEFKTDFKGEVHFESDAMDEHPTVIFEHPEYITSKFNIQITAGTIFFNRFSVSPVMKIGDIRIVLDWDKDPRDLDAHFVKEGGYHISFRNMRVASDSEAKLDRDDTDSYGPETITVNSIDQNANYEYYVHDYTNRGNENSNALSKSKATVKVYSRTQGLLYVFTVPLNLQGTKWSVFKIINGKIIPQ